MLKCLRWREARPAPRYWNLLKTLVQTTVFWSVFLFILPSVIFPLEEWCGLQGFRFSTVGSRWCGCLLFAVAGLLGLSSGYVMASRGAGTPLPLDCPRELVVSGPYRYIRNPMALAGITQGVAVGIFLGSPAVIAYALTGAFVWDWIVRPLEELDLERRFGVSYTRYRDSIRCWLPHLRGYAPAAMEGARSTCAQRDLSKGYRR